MPSFFRWTPHHSLRISALSLLVFTACSDGSNSTQERAFGINATSYCQAVNEAFWLALDVHIRKTRGDAQSLYQDILIDMLKMYFPVDSEARTRLAQRIFKNDGKADIERLNECQDIAEIQNAVKRNPPITAAMTVDESGLMQTTLGGFLMALGWNLDMFSQFTPEIPEGTPSAQQDRSFHYGILVDVEAAILYSVKSLDSVRVEAVQDPKSPLKHNDRITAIIVKNSNGSLSETEISKYSPEDFRPSSANNPFTSNSQSEISVRVERPDAQGVYQKLPEPLKLTGLSNSSRRQAMPVVGGALYGNIAYVRFFKFTEDSAFQLAQLIHGLKAEWRKRQLSSSSSQVDEDKDLGILLDLRFNPGGLVSHALQILALFVGYQQVGVIRTRSGDIPAYSFANGVTEPIQNPTVVLVNHASGSSSEIVATALQDLKRATLVGTRTYGKGIGQADYSIHVKGLKIGDLTLSDRRFFGPGGENIQIVGRTPDVDGVEDSKHREWYLAKKKECDSGEAKTQRECILRMEDQKNSSIYGPLLIPQAGPIGSCGQPVDSALSRAELDALVAKLQKPGSTIPPADEVRVDEATLYASRLLSLQLNR